MDESGSNPSRRAFLWRGAAAMGITWAGLHWPSVLAVAQTAAGHHAESGPWQNLTIEEAAVLGAVADRIYPPDESPGARDLGVVRFMDGALGDFLAGALPMIRSGCADLDRRAPGEGTRFADLPPEGQDGLLKEIEAEPFFATAHFLTLCGLFTLPVYGGNQDYEAWRLLGFEPRHHWQPPFGHYDANQDGDEQS